MSHIANHKRNSLLFTLAFALVFLLVLPLQAKTTRSEQTPLQTTQNDTDAIRLLRSDEFGVTFEVSPPELVRTAVETEKGIYNQVRMPGFDYTGIVGQPDLPQKGFLIALPPGAVPVLNLVSAENQTITDSRIAPTVEQTLLNENYDYADISSADYVPEFEAAYPFDESVYGKDANYPTAPVSLGAETSLRHQRAVWVIVNPVQFNPVQETLTVYSKLQIDLSFEFPNGRPAVETLEPESGPFAEILQANLLNYNQSVNWRVRPQEASVMPETSPCMDPNAFRFDVKQTGMYEVTYSELKAAYAGLPSTVPANKIRMCHNDQEIRIKINDNDTDGNFENGDSLIFYGQSIKTQETETNVYWLTYSINGVNGIRMTAGIDTVNGTAPAHYIPSYHIETDQKYIPQIPWADLTDHWFWGDPIEGEPGASVDRLDIPFQMSNKASGVYNFTIRFELWGWLYNESHPFDVELNGILVGSGQFNGAGTANATYTYEGNAPSSALQNGSNTVSIIAKDSQDPDPNKTNKILINWVEIEPRRQFVAQSNRLAFSMDTPDTYTFAAGNFTSGATVEIFDVTDPYNATIQSKTAAGGSVTFNRTITGPSSYELAATNAYSSPDAIIKDSIGSGLLTGNNTADYIIITVPSLDSALTPLRTRRAAQGLTVKTVFVQDIFDEFSYGRYATYAIQDFLEYAYNNWNGDPDYVLLAGDASYDHRNVLGTNGNSNLVPVYLRSGIDDRLGEAASDNQYVAFAPGSDMAQMMLGRLPAQDPAELTNMINKIITYETATDDPLWRGRHLLIADNPYVPVDCNIDPAGDFFQTVNDFIDNRFPDNQTFSRLYYAPSSCFPNNSGPYTTMLPHYITSLNDMQNLIEQEFSAGYQFISYTGHSGSQNWAHEVFFQVSRISAVQNGDRTPIMLPMTCLEGWYHNSGTTPGLSEALLKRVGGGAVASYAPTGFQVQHGHSFLIEGFYEAVFDNNVQTIGEAVIQAKVNLGEGTPYDDLHDTFMLLGDPAMKFNISTINLSFLPASLNK